MPTHNHRRYGLREWFDDWETGGGVWDPTATAGAAGDGERFAAPVRLPCGSVANPLQCLWWAASWRRFREDTVMDNAVYSELSPLTAPAWSLSVEWVRVRVPPYHPAPAHTFHVLPFFELILSCNLLMPYYPIPVAALPELLRRPISLTVAIQLLQQTSP